jgi:hypothetical protein
MCGPIALSGNYAVPLRARDTATAFNRDEQPAGHLCVMCLDSRTNRVRLGGSLSCVTKVLRCPCGKPLIEPVLLVRRKMFASFAAVGEAVEMRVMPNAVFQLIG